MRIWKREPTLELLNESSKKTLAEAIKIQFSEIGDDFLKATMPVDWWTKQPAGLLHGGASVALAETMGSVASFLCAETPAHRCVGLEVNANHLKSMTGGFVTGTVRPLRVGRTTHVWEIRITDEKGELVCISRLTVAVLPPKTS